MSRCFPFPPPGYENKVKIEDFNLLKKKHKEKRHKKEKDRDKREGKEKKHKDRSSKHKEKKEKKHKHRKKKEKDKDHQTNECVALELNHTLKCTNILDPSIGNKSYDGKTEEHDVGTGIGQESKDQIGPKNHETEKFNCFNRIKEEAVKDNKKDNLPLHEGTAKKRKLELNGTLPDDGINAVKLGSSNGQQQGDSHKHKQNGVIDHRLSLHPSMNSSIKPINGVIVSQHPSSSLPLNPKLNPKPAHPDTKYLTQILSVPKMDAWSDFDDQEWLFSNRASREHTLRNPSADEVQLVWANAFRIDSHDICVLPYVIPY